MANSNTIDILAQRSSGVLLPIFSLPGPHAIGDIGKPALRFIDFLHQAGQRYWQILPSGPTDPAFANSPYMSPSAFAGNPLFISIDALFDDGLLENHDRKTIDTSEYIVDYPKALQLKQSLLRKAWQRFIASNRQDTLDDFSKSHPWIKDYSLFQILKKRYANAPWFNWPEAIKKRDPETLKNIRQECAPTLSYHTFEQYLFFRQWRKLRNYASQHDVRLIGDLPIYVATDSADAWANQSIFQLDPRTSQPTNVAGVPPDYFSETGQHWGNPLYRWKTSNKKTKTTLWNWWAARFRHNFLLTDVIRIDHFRGFESYWSIPATEETAMNGKWIKGPGLPFFREMEKKIGKLPIIAEDLGIITPAVEKLRTDLGYPGMRVLMFAFDGDTNNNYLPHNYENNTVVYTGTHDNDTAVGWYLNPSIPVEDKQRAKRYANQSDMQAGLFHKDLLYIAHSSVANIAIVPMQDLLGFGNDCRVNTPGTVKDNWQWRCAPRFITPELANWLKEHTITFGRMHSTEPKKEQR